MAVAGLQSVPAQDSLILGDSRSLESVFHGNHGRLGTRTSSVLQICRELEDEYAVGCSNGTVRSRFLRQNANGLRQSQENEGREGMEGFEEASESENGDGSASDVHIGPLSEHEDHQSITSEQSSDLGESERKRVRKIFHEWMNNGVMRHRPSGTSGSTSPKSQWLGERELERVRVVREWIQMTAQQGDALGGPKEEQAGEIGVQIERVREGLILDTNQGQIENPSPRRGILRLCGRQALLDLLAKRVQELQAELKVLVECKAVSSFPFRTRIQSSLRVRFLLNKRLGEHDRPNSAMESELGLLRQRSTVSDLREGFMSKLGETSHVSAGDHMDSSSGFCSDGLRNEEENLADCSTEDLDDSNGQHGPLNHEINFGTLLSPTGSLAGTSSEGENTQGPVTVAFQEETRLQDASDDSDEILTGSVDTSHRPADIGNVGIGDGVHLIYVPSNTDESIDIIDHHKCCASTSLAKTGDLPISISEDRNLVGSVYVQAETGLEHALDNGVRIEDESVTEEESAHMAVDFGLEHAIDRGERNQTESNFDEVESSSHEEQWQLVYNSEFEGRENNQLEGADEVIPEQHDIDNEGVMSYGSGSFQGSTVEHVHGLDPATQVEDRHEQEPGDGERVSGGSGLTNAWENAVHEELGWHEENWQGQVAVEVDRDSEGSGISDVWRNFSRQDVVDRNMGESDHETLHDNLGDGIGNQVALAPLHVDDYEEETTGDGQEEISVGRGEANYYSDDDHTYRTELRELLSRRRVSSLLHSGFSVRLNRLVQSYVERQTQSVRAWDLQEISLPAGTQNQELPGIDQNEEPSVVDAFSHIQQPSAPRRPPERRWDQVLRHSTWSRHDIRHRPGTEFEMINDLRIDMARLQQRLNTMQRMLETCMDMQFELQRSVRQEVSAALNRPSGPAQDTLLEQGSNLDYVRKGVCCLCCEGTIDSLLYRCGHMCTCTECASGLVAGNGRCPMCQAPVLEVIRAFTIQ
ncbi:hypothetical protein Droror1_Dr00004048 [Drosera rotundifolia]